MAKTLIGNIKGKNGRGITSIKKTGTTGPVDTYTITYTDDTTSTFTVNNSDSISLQRQIVPSAAVESSTTASQAYAAGDYVVVSGILRKVTSSIVKGNAISDSNSTATTVTGELANLAISRIKVASGGASIYGCNATLDVYYVPAMHSLAFETTGSGYMATGTEADHAFKALTLPSDYWPANARYVCLCANLQLKFGVTLRVQTNGDVMFDISAAEPMRGFGWPAATGFIPL